MTDDPSPHHPDPPRLDPPRNDDRWTPPSPYADSATEAAVGAGTYEAGGHEGGGHEAGSQDTVSQDAVSQDAGTSPGFLPGPPAGDEWDRRGTEQTTPLPELFEQPVLPPPAPGHRRDAARPAPPGWLWPAVAVLALVVGLAGGALGGALYAELGDDGGPGLDPRSTRTAPPLEEGNLSVSAVAEELLPSTVQVLAGGSDDGATGSGFVLDTKGHVVTNNHVVAGAEGGDGLVVVDFRGRRHDATVVGASRVYDLAVLLVEEASDLRPASLGASETLLVGDPVVAFGAPLGLSQTVTSGIVSALNRPVTTGESNDDSSFINAVQTDAAINPGNSGGPLVNLGGQVVGVNSAIATTGGFLREAGNIGVGFAIPIEQVRTTADQILSTGEARYPVIGATVQTGGTNDLQGARIDEVMEGTPAEKAGLRKDDVVVAVGGDRVTDGIALIVSIRTHQPGETVEFTVLRDGDERVVEVTLDSEVG